MQSHQFVLQHVRDIAMLQTSKALSVFCLMRFLGFLFWTLKNLAFCKQNLALNSSLKPVNGFIVEDKEKFANILGGCWIKYTNYQELRFGELKLCIYYLYRNTRCNHSLQKPCIRGYSAVEWGENNWNLLFMRDNCFFLC